MRALLWVLTLFALAVGVALAAHYNDGYVLLVVPGYRAEISLNLLLGGLLLLFFLLHLVLRSLSLLLALPRHVRDFHARRQREKAAEQYYDMARLVFEGRFGRALKLAGTTYAAGHRRGLAALLAARAAQRLQATEVMRDWLQRAREADPALETACLMLEAESQVERQDYTAALATLEQLRTSDGRHIAAWRLELRARQGCGDWDEALRLARQLEKHEALGAAELAEIVRRAGETARS